MLFVEREVENRFVEIEEDLFSKVAPDDEYVRCRRPPRGRAGTEGLRATVTSRDLLQV